MIAFLTSASVWPALTVVWICSMGAVRAQPARAPIIVAAATQRIIFFMNTPIILLVKKIIYRVGNIDT
jgi:hypothetical protein